VSVADNIKEAFSGTRGKVLIVGGVAVVGYLWWTRGRGGSAEPTEELVPDTGSAGRTPQTDPTVGNDSQTDAGKKSTRPETNDQWITQGVDVLTGRGTPGGTAFNALNRALLGEAITAQEAGLVNQVISVLGSPPGGMPPLNISAPATGGQANSGIVVPPSHLRVGGTSRTSIFFRWVGPKNADGYKVYISGGATGSYGPIAAPEMEWKGLKPNTSYTFQVTAIVGGVETPKSGSLTARTKK
jgi:hypothetical protein